MRPPSPSGTSEGAGPTSTGTPSGVDIAIPFKVAKDALVETFERSYVTAVLSACGGNMTKAARQAGIDRMYLHRIVQKHGLKGGGGSGSGPSSPPSTP